jgi:hypothetical protein
MIQDSDIEWIKKNEPRNVLYRLKRGLVGYISYLAACEMNESFSEYILYEPMLRILTARRFRVECEYPIGLNEDGNQVGDKKRIDFLATSLINPNLRFFLEVKWAKTSRLNIRNDHAKLYWCKENIPNVKAFLCVFGRDSFITGIHLQYPKTLEGATFKERGGVRTADLGITKYSCRIFELKNT